MKNILITGGTGYLGTCLSNKFVKKGYSIHVPTRRSHVELNRLNSQNIRFIHFKTYHELCEKLQDVDIDLVIHCACAYGKENEDFADIIKSNYNYGFEIMHALGAKVNTIKFININTSLDKFTNLYAFTKKQFSEMAKFLSNQSMFFENFINVELEHYFGPHASEQNFIQFLISRLQKSVNSIDLTNGDQVRDFIYIDDVVDAIHFLSEIEFSEVYYDIALGTGRGLRVSDAVKHIKSQMQSSVDLNFGALPYRENEMMESIADIKFLNKLGWHPKYSFETGVEEILIRMER